MKYDDLDYISEDLVYQAVLCTEREESFRGVTGKEVKNEVVSTGIKLQIWREEADSCLRRLNAQDMW